MNALRSTANVEWRNRETTLLIEEVAEENQPAFCARSSLSLLLLRPSPVAIGGGIEEAFRPAWAGDSQAAHAGKFTADLPKLQRSIYQPQAHTNKAAERYFALFDLPISSPDASMTRAYVGNQKESIDHIAGHLSGTASSGSPGFQKAVGTPNHPDPAQERLRTETYAFFKNLLSSKGGEYFAKYSWLSNAVAGFGLDHITAVNARLTTLAAETPAGQALGEVLTKRFNKLINLLGITHTVSAAIASEGRPAAKALSAPVLIEIEVSLKEIEEAARVQLTDPGTGKIGRKKQRTLTQWMRQFKHAQDRGSGLIKVMTLTDEETLVKLKGDVQAIAQASREDMSLDSNEQRLARKRFAGTGLSAAALLYLYSEENLHIQATIEQLKDAVKHLPPRLSGTRQAVSELFMSTEGRLALGGLLAQSIGLFFALSNIRNTKDKSEWEIQKMSYGLYGSLAGTIDALSDFCRVGVQANFEARAARILLRTESRALTTASAQQLGYAAAKQTAEAAVKEAKTALVNKNWGLTGLRVVGNVGGAVSALMTAISAKADGEDATLKKHRFVAGYYYLSGAAFAIVTLTSLGQGAGALATTLVARQIGTRSVLGPLIRGLAARLGAGGALVTVLGFGVTISGIGLVALGAGVAFQIVAVSIIPNEIQLWIARSRFGVERSGIPFIANGQRKDKFTGEHEEAEALELMLARSFALPPDASGELGRALA